MFRLGLFFIVVFAAIIIAVLIEYIMYKFEGGKESFWKFIRRM